MIEPFDAVVVYKDGRRVSVHVGLLEMMSVEQKYLGENRTIIHENGDVETVTPNTPHQSMMYYGLWLASGRPLGSVEDWLATVETLDDPEEASTAPTEPAPGAGSSRKSPQKRKSTRGSSSPTSS